MKYLLILLFFPILLPGQDSTLFKPINPLDSNLFIWTYSDYVIQDSCWDVQEKVFYQTVCDRSTICWKRGYIQFQDCKYTPDWRPKVFLDESFKKEDEIILNFFTYEWKKI